MKRIKVIPDLHGRYECLIGLYISDCDYVVFLGDIFDSFDRSKDDQIKAFQLILNMKEMLGEKFIWLLGNHDVHYLEYHNMDIRGSGFDKYNYLTYHKLLSEHKHLYKTFWVHDDFIFSHAGITSKFLNGINLSINELLDLGYDNYVNESGYNHLPKQFYYCGKERGGIHEYSGLFWTGMNELNNNPVIMRDNNGDIIPCNQVVGHTVLSAYETVLVSASTFHYFFDAPHNDRTIIRYMTGF